MKSLKVFKIGGKVIDQEEKLDAFLGDLVKVEGKKVLVHGGGSAATRIGEKLGLKAKMIEGRRVTDEETLDLITMVYGGLLNRNIVAKLQAEGAKAVGLSGADLNVIQAKKRNPEPIDFGWVGDVETVNVDWLLEFLRHGVIPVMAPLTHDGKGHILNTNADTIASFIASVLAEYFETELVFCFEQDGVMKGDKLLRNLSHRDFSLLKEDGIIKNGMIPKLELGFHALRRGAVKVKVKSSETILKAKSGTELKL